MHPSFQPLLTSLEQERQDLHTLLQAYSDESLNQAPGPGKWSAVQVMHHLILSEELSLKYLQKKLSFNPTLEKAGWKSQMRKGLLKLYLGLPFKFKAPKGVNDEALPDFVSLADTMARWESARNGISDFLEKAPDTYIDKELYKHPFAGKLTLSGMLEFYQHHFRRHREQIIRTLG